MHQVKLQINVKEGRLSMHWRPVIPGCYKLFQLRYPFFYVPFQANYGCQPFITVWYGTGNGLFHSQVNVVVFKPGKFLPVLFDKQVRFAEQGGSLVILSETIMYQRPVQMYACLAQPVPWRPLIAFFNEINAFII